MLLRRQTTASPPAFTTVALQGVTRDFTPETAPGDLKQGDKRLVILNDEIAAAGWPGPPRVRDSIVDNGTEWAVLGSMPAWDGPQLIGHVMWVRG